MSVNCRWIHSKIYVGVQIRFEFDDFAGGYVSRFSLSLSVVWQKLDGHALAAVVLDRLHLPDLRVAVLPGRDHRLVVQPHQTRDLRLRMRVYAMD